MKKRKLKKQPMIALAIIVVVVILIIFGVKQYQSYVYHNSTEYKLLEKGYKQEEIDVFKSKLEKKEFDALVDKDKDVHLASFLKEKYYLHKNLDRYLAYKKEFKDKEYNDIVAIVNVGADNDWYEEAKPSKIEDEYSILVNKYNYIDETFAPEDIVKISNWYAYEGHSIREEVLSAYMEMWNAAKEEEITLIVYSSYRKYEEQKLIYDDYENRRGQEYADSIAARAGYSEHQTGLSLDIVEYGLKESKDFVNTDAYKWLLEHAHEYGFILRFPENKEHLTGYAFESWHYRYLGEDLATKVYNEGITYDEYYAFYLDK